MGSVRPALPWLATVALVSVSQLRQRRWLRSDTGDDKLYVGTLVSGLEARPLVGADDLPVPDNVMIGWFGERRATSTVLAGTEQHAVFDVPSENMMMVDDRGRRATSRSVRNPRQTGTGKGLRVPRGRSHRGAVAEAARGEPRSCPGQLLRSPRT